MGRVITSSMMRNVVKFERPTKSLDNAGGQDEFYDEWFTTCGMIKRKRGYNSFTNGYDESVNQYDLWVPWRNELEANISKDVRVIFEARSFRIDTFTLVDELRRFYHIELTEVR